MSNFEYLKIPHSKELTVTWLQNVLEIGGLNIEHFEEIEILENKSDIERGVLSRLERIKCKNGREQLNLIIKSVPENEDTLKFGFNGQFYHREIMVYKKIFKDTEILQDSLNFPLNLRFRHPKCYFGEESGENSEDYRMLLILEDLTDDKWKFKPYENFEKRPFDRPHTMAVIKQLALFHAQTMAYKFHKKIENFLDEYPFIVDFLNLSINLLDLYIELGFGPIIKYLEEELVCQDLIEKLKVLKENGEKILKELLIPDPDDDFGVVAHIDLHGNNILFAETENGEIDACIIDYQTVTNGRPGTDLAILLLQSCDLSLISWRKNNLNEILEFYQITFEKAMEEMGIVIKYPLEKLKNDFETCLLSATILYIMNAPLFIFGPNSDQNARERMKNALIEVYERGTLDKMKKFILSK